MSHNILIAAAALGGSIRSFEQHEAKGMRGNCMIHSARWLRAKQKQGDFIKKYGTHSIGTRHFNLPDEARVSVEEDRGYGKVGHDPEAKKIYLHFDRRQATDAVEEKANKIRERIKPADRPFAPYEAKLQQYVEGGRKNLHGEAKPGESPKILFRKEGEGKNITFITGWDEELLQELAPGYYFGSFFGEVPHAVAFFITEKEFWYFDPCYGELKLERSQASAWLKHPDVTKYFKSGGRTFMGLTSYVPV